MLATSMTERGGLDTLAARTGVLTRCLREAIAKTQMILGDRNPKGSVP